MFQITEQQIEKRWDILPISLLEVLCSFDTAKMISEICKKNHIIGEKKDKISGLIGFVIIGFLHPEDLVQEIKDATGIHPEIAETIVKELDRKIFAPIRGEIDKVYSPAGALTEEKLAEESAPPVEISEEHIVDLRTLKREEAAVKENVKSEEKEILTPSAANQTEPIIIHKEESARPILGAKRSLGGLFGFLRGEKEAEPKAVEAKIEIGRMAEEMSKEIPEPPKLKVVHYSEFKTPVADSLSKTDDKREELPVPVSP